MSVTRELTAAEEHAVDIARATAAAYVWGRQDAGESGKDTGYSLEFADYFAAMKAAYLREERHMLPSVGDAFTEWRDTKAIAPPK
jgi:hypothetical protein